MAYYVCNKCGFRSIKWYGKCPECGEWDTFEEVREEADAPRKKRLKATRLKPKKTQDKIMTGFAAIDELLGGFLKGAVYLFYGEPGVGKTTLLLDIAVRVSRTPTYSNQALIKTLFISSEESEDRIAQKLERINGEVEFVFASDVEEVFSLISDYDFVVLDSLPALLKPSISREFADVINSLVALVRKENKVLVITDHITKAGQSAGPKFLEHIVDVVVSMSWYTYRRVVVKALKNRFAPLEAKVLEWQEGKLVEGSVDFGRGIYTVDEKLNVLKVDVRAGYGVVTNMVDLRLATYFLKVVKRYKNVKGGVFFAHPYTLQDSGGLLSLFAAALVGDRLKERVVFLGNVTPAGEILPSPDEVVRLEFAHSLGFKVASCLGEADFVVKKVGDLIDMV